MMLISESENSENCHSHGTKRPWKRCSLFAVSLGIWFFLAATALTRAQIGSPGDPICRLRALPDGAVITGKLEYDVKAAVLFRCVELVHWPADAFASSPSTLQIGILGKNQFGESLDCLRGKTVGGRKLVVKKVARLKPNSHFQLIFVSSSESEQTSKILNSLSRKPVVTIGEIPGFTLQGGMINLLVEGKNLRFEINQGVAEKAGVMLDPILIKLAEALAAPPPIETSSSDALGPKS
jgi:hypothetical protein